MKTLSTPVRTREAEAQARLALAQTQEATKNLRDLIIPQSEKLVDALAYAGTPSFGVDKFYPYGRRANVFHRGDKSAPMLYWIIEWGRNSARYYLTADGCLRESRNTYKLFNPSRSTRYLSPSIVLSAYRHLSYFEQDKLGLNKLFPELDETLVALLKGKHRPV